MYEATGWGQGGRPDVEAAGPDRGLGRGGGIRCNSAIRKVFKDYVIQHKIVETQELESRVTRTCLLDGNFSATGLGTCTARKVVPSCEL
jgi:hypothetical protein